MNDKDATSGFFYKAMMLFAILLTISCESDEEHLEPLPYQVLVGIQATTTITFEEGLQGLMDQGNMTEEEIAPYRKKLDMASMRTRRYDAHVVTYHTTDPNGHPVVASGVVYYPKTGKPRGVIEAVSLNKTKYECPSKQLANFSLMQGMAGFIVIVSDMIGAGATDDMVFPYYYHDNAAKVCADLRLAATELVRNVYGRSMPAWTLISGYSLAASEAWALARYYHKHPELGVNVNQVWIGGGAYQPIDVLDHQLRTLTAEYVSAPSVYYSVNHYDSLGLDLREMFRGELREHYEEWCTGNMALADVSQKLGPDISQYMNLDFFKDDNEDYLRLRASIERFTIPNDWVPTCDVHIYHGRNDTYVPIACSDKLVAYLRSVGTAVDYVVTETGHLENGLTMASDLAELLYK
jgi:pimeloyl-ACP methyl ester carboxylesterase